MREMCGIDGAICCLNADQTCAQCPVMERIRQTQVAGQKLAMDIQRGVYKQ